MLCDERVGTYFSVCLYLVVYLLLARYLMAMTSKKAQTIHPQTITATRLDATVHLVMMIICYVGTKLLIIYMLHPCYLKNGVIAILS